ncbi:MAG: hypothetical protein QOI80_108 [Solirubrobacteraceae bacterium]|nr:hypothetical protein [Solirubrobacteraceae bacterium]
MMSVAATTAPAPGWYPDPARPDEQLRWWDGSTWSAYTTDVPQPEPEPEAPHPFADIVVDFAPDDGDVPAEDLYDEAVDAADAESEPIEFSWADPEERFEVTLPEPEGNQAPSNAFTFRARDLRGEPGPVGIEIPSIPVYESPLAAISSPLSVRVEVPVRVEPPPPPAPTAAPAPPAAPVLPPSRRRLAFAGTGAVVAVAATAAVVTNLLAGDDAPKAGKAAPAGAALSAAGKQCLKEWNTTASAGAAQLRVTLGQFEGALARVGPVDPLPGTVMAAGSCALSVYDPATDTHAIFVSGVQDTVGYLDVTSYPRAKTYGWPKTTRQANVTIRSDGSLRSL